MPRILFLTIATTRARQPLGDAPHNDNHKRLPAAFSSAGWRVQVADHDAVRLTDAVVCVGERPIDDFDLVWLVGLGSEATFLDRMQLLGLAGTTRFINEPRALLTLHGKYRWGEFTAETHAATDPSALARLIEAGGDWVLKPPAGSFGRGVARISAREPDWRERLERATEAGRRYLILQRYLPDAQTREKRVVMAGRAIVGAYRRRLLDPTKPARNLGRGGAPAPTTLHSGEKKMLEALGERLVDQGVNFAGIDLSYPYLLEVNIANPGGLATLAALYGCDPTPSVVAAVTAEAGQ